MSFIRWFVMAATLPVLLSTPAKAHFLFVRILPPAEGGRAAEVYFSELAEAGDSRFVDERGSRRVHFTCTSCGRVQ